MCLKDFDTKIITEASAPKLQASKVEKINTNISQGIMREYKAQTKKTMVKSNFASTSDSVTVISQHPT